MRFGLPRSASPSPVRGYRRGASTFGLHSDSEDDYDFHAYDSDSSSSSSSSSSASTSSSSSHPQVLNGFGLLSLSKGPADGRVRDPVELRQKEDAIASIRLWTRHRDPYEEWEKETRKESFKSARKILSTTQTSLQDAQSKIISAQEQSLVSKHAIELKMIEDQLSQFRLVQEQEERALRERLVVREKKLWERIEGVIRIEEDKVKAKLEEERKKREAEEAAKREAEMRRKLLEEKKKKEEEKQKQEEEKRLKEEEEKKKKEAQEKEEERLRKEKEDADSGARKALGFTTPSEDWKRARESLFWLKDQVTSVVKGNKEHKAAWNKVRRQITPKIGQITPDNQSVETISTQLLHLLKPSPPHEPVVYVALCNSLAKAIILQAETEVTAEKRSAAPLARVAFNLLTTLDMFPDVFWAKIVQRVGGWPIPSTIPEVDIDGRAWGSGPKGKGRGGDKERWRVMGYRPSSSSNSDLETSGEFMVRVAGIMRVYWEIVKVQLGVPARAPPDGPFAITRYWVWFARMLDHKALLSTSVGAELIYTALEVLGSEASDIWGNQWIKILHLLYEGTTTGIYGEKDKLIGGDSPEGKAAKARVQMEIERIVQG